MAEVSPLLTAAPRDPDLLEGEGVHQGTLVRGAADRSGSVSGVVTL